MSVPNIKILSQVVSEKSRKKKFTDKQTNIVTEKAKTIYPLYTSYAGGINIFSSPLIVIIGFNFNYFDNRLLLEPAVRFMTRLQPSFFYFCGFLAPKDLTFRTYLFKIFEPHYEETCFLHMRKTKPQISCAETAQLSSAFVFAKHLVNHSAS